MYMKLRSILGVATVACALTGLSVSNVSASSVTFDDVAGGALPSNYGGLSWDPNASVYDVTNYNNGYSNSVSFPSNPNAVYNGHGVQTFNVTSPSVITLDDAWFIGWGSDNSSQSYTSTSVSVTGFLSGNPVGTWSTTLSSAAFTDLSFGGTPVNAFPPPLPETTNGCLMTFLFLMPPHPLPFPRPQ